MENSKPGGSLWRSPFRPECHPGLSALAKRHIREVWGAALGISALVVLLVFAGTPVFADSGLTVSGAKLAVTLSPGDTFIHQITISIGSDDQPVDMTVQVSPMAQALDGTPLPSQDAGPYSASSFITLDLDSFHLDPGGKQVVNATIRIPKNVGDGGRYALINVATQPPAGSTFSVVTAVNIPIYITVKGSHLTNQGKITSLSADVSNSQAIEVVSVFENTSNHDFKIKNNLTLIDSQGRIVASTNTGLSLWTIIPGMSREIQADLYPEVDLSPGSYRVASQITLDDGTILSNGDTNVELATGLPAVTPPPSTGTPSSNVAVVPRAKTTNWVSIILLIIGVAILFFMVGLFVTIRRLRRPSIAGHGPIEDINHIAKTQDGVQLSSLIYNKEIPSTPVSAGELPQQPNSFLNGKSITIRYFLTVRNQIGVGDLSLTPKTGNVYLVVTMNIENHGYESFKMHPYTNTYVVIGNVKYNSALVLNLENILPDEIVILNGENIEGKLGFEVPKDAANNTCQLIYENSLTYNMKWIDRNLTIQ